MDLFQKTNKKCFPFCYFCLLIIDETILENKVYLTMTMFKYPLDGDFSPWKNREEGPKEFHAKYTGINHFITKGLNVQNIEIDQK